MRRETATVDSKGRITIAVEIRNHLSLTPGAAVEFVIEDDSSVSIRRPGYAGIDSLIGAAGTMPSELWWDEVRDIAREDGLQRKASRL